MSFAFRRDDLSAPEVRALIAAHHANSHAHSPPESVHALPLEGLSGPEVDFFTLWEYRALLGCGALRRMGGSQGEIKSMHVAEAYRGRGLGRLILRHLEAHAAGLGIARLWLETGSMAAYAPARALYAAAGYAPCPPFGDYRADPNSVFMSRELGAKPREETA